MADRGISYDDAGVNLDAARALTEGIRDLVHGGTTGFAGTLPMPPMRDGVLVACTDGVGTKVLLARQMGDVSGLGQDLVAMSVNDLVCTGARPLFFLDYLAVGKLDPDEAKVIVGSVREACLSSGCVLLGGETAEMPGLYAEGHFDMAGFAVGAVERAEMLGPEKVQVGDVIVGIESSGIHSNGYSLVRKLVDGGAVAPDPLLLAPTRLYPADIKALQASGVELHAAAHITGGGLPENLPSGKSRPPRCGAGARRRRRGRGLGLGHLQHGPRHVPGDARGRGRAGARDRGRVAPGGPRGGRARRTGLGGLMYRVVVMVSGNGSNLQALIDNVHRNPKVDAEIVLVVCSKDGAKALERAAAVGIPTEVVALADPSQRIDRDARLNEVIGRAEPDLIVMAGWMSIVTGTFLDAFPDKVINLHPSLLPSFPGMHAIQEALDWGVRLTGVTVHIAEEAVDGGPPILQEPVPILAGDTYETLAERIHGVEHRLLSRCVTLYSQGRIDRDPAQPRRMIVNDGGS